MIAEGGAVVGLGQVASAIGVTRVLSRAFSGRGPSGSEQRAKARAALEARVFADLAANKKRTDAIEREQYRKVAAGIAARRAARLAAELSTRRAPAVYAQQPTPSYQVPDLIYPGVRTLVGVAQEVLGYQRNVRAAERMARRAGRYDPSAYEGDYLYGTAPSEFSDESYAGINAPLIRGSLQDPQGRIRPRFRRPTVDTGRTR